MKVYAKRSILSVYSEVGIDGKIEKLELKIKNLRGPEKKYDSSKKCVDPNKFKALLRRILRIILISQFRVRQRSSVDNSYNI